MTTINNIIQKLNQVSDNKLKNELQKYKLSISIDKYNTAFSCFGVTKLLSGLDVDIVRGGLKEIPAPYIEGIRWSSIIVFRAYITFVYMRSDILERGLDRVDNSSCLKVYKEVFRAGCRNKSEDTLAQHIRNSLCHGSFKISDDFNIIQFNDRKWNIHINVKEFDSLCYHIYRLYRLAFEVKSKINENGT
ncbi:MAG: hypothetical protein ACOYVE_02785 [Melioribacter sp.]|uniref:hypothetical protein n=1 Tax=Melioribacter sp. TaxID=2052167 RepID=UPI003BD5ABC3